MGLLKQRTDRKATIEESAPIIGNVRALGALSVEYAPVGGVSIEQYAEISRCLAAIGYDRSRAREVVAAHGVGSERWPVAVAGWNRRIIGNAAVALRFNALYTRRAGTGPPELNV